MSNSAPRSTKKHPGVFARPELASQLAQRLLGQDLLFNYGRSGLFLAGPRRTGKSTFLEHDLVPQIERLQALPIYVDLWEEPGADPADLIAEAIRDAMRKADRPITKTKQVLRHVKKMTLKAKIPSIFGTEFGIQVESVGRKGGTTLAKAFKALNTHTGRSIVLIIDEVQHALSSVAGTEMLFALKAARDALNVKNPAAPQLVVLATGSVRSKISALVLKKGEAFFGAAVADFPLLGSTFVEFVLRTKLKRFRLEEVPSAEDATNAFELVGNRPEDFDLVLQRAVTSSKSLDAALIEQAVLRRVEILNELKRQLAPLTPLQRAVLQRMADEDAQFAPFRSDAIVFYGTYCNRPRSKKAFTNGDVQRALDSLERKHRLVWRSSRGAYALDDHMIGELFNDERMAEEIRLLTDPSSASLSPQHLREHGFFEDVSEEDWPSWENEKNE